MRLIEQMRLIAADDGGAAAVEFALLAPVLCIIYFGVAELTQAAMANERAAHTTSSIGDLAAQNATVTKAEVADIFAVSNTVMYPYPTSSLEMRLTSVVADNKGTATVAWSQASGMAALSKNAKVTRAGLSNVLDPNQSVIMAEASYTYTSAVGYILPRPITFNDVYYLRPRLSTQVTCSDC